MKLLMMMKDLSFIHDEAEELEALGLKPNQFFIEMLDTQGLGFCATEEELEILYRALTSKYIEE